MIREINLSKGKEQITVSLKSEGIEEHRIKPIAVERCVNCVISRLPPTLINFQIGFNCEHSIGFTTNSSYPLTPDRSKKFNS